MRRLSELMPDCSARIRVASWSADISSEKKATPAPGDWPSSMPSCRSRINRIAAEKAMLVARSEEHTSELQSLMRISYAVFCLKKKNQHTHIHTRIQQHHH